MLPREQKHPNWKGGERIDSRGYKLIYRPAHPQANRAGYVFEHRLIAEKMLGRFLQKNEVVHHINGNPLDNRTENLMLFSSHAEHETFHHAERAKQRIESRKKWLQYQYIILGLSSSQIASLINVSRSTIKRWLIEFNIPRRSYAEAGRGERNSRWKGEKTIMRKGTAALNFVGGDLCT